MRRYVDGLGPWLAVASVLCVVGVLAFLLEIQSASWVQWHGIKVQGDTFHGVTTYHYGGMDYSINNPDVPATDSHHRPTTVWLPYGATDQPDRAYIENAWNRWTDFVFVVGWFFLALVIVTAGLVRRARDRRRRAQMSGEFGGGISSDVVERILAARQAPPWLPPASDE